jgi:hypothetical protein
MLRQKPHLHCLRNLLTGRDPRTRF